MLSWAFPPRLLRLRPLPTSALALLLLGLAGCATHRPLTADEEKLVFTVDTVRARGILVPLPFERQFTEASRDHHHYDGSTTVRYRFDPPESAQFPFYFESTSAIYRIPGQAAASRLAFDLGLRLTGLPPTDTQPVEFPGLADEASISLLHPNDSDHLVGGFLLSARTHNRLFLLAMAGNPAADPAAWFPDIESCLLHLATYGTTTTTTTSSSSSSKQPDS
ncbi:hypothetical protein BH23VER1_BH23VER1_13390 [soil metagenome]